MSKRSVGPWMVVAVGVAFALAVLPAFGDSQVRIVRLSDVEGTVLVDRNSGHGNEKAFLNMPMVQGMTVATKDGRAEVEFEDGSALRLGPNATVEFTDLLLRDSGARVSTITVKTGMVYVNYVARQREDEFTIAFAEERARLDEAARFRLDVARDTAELAVFNGELKVDGPSGQAEVSKNKTAVFNLLDNEKFTIAKGIDEAPLDAWDRELNKYHDEYAKKSSYGNNPYGYGLSDLNYYGSYYDVPGYGWMWQPYFTGVGWDPFADGAWMFYPGFGWMWVSSYPWGWMPYRYGSWQFVSGYGWLWAPGGWGGWSNIPLIKNPPNRFPRPVPPVRGTTTVVVGHPTGILSATTPPRRLVVHNGSAGLGIPRGSVANLNRVSREVQQTGSMTVHTSGPVRSVGMGASGSTWGGISHSGGSVAGGSHVSSSGGTHMSTGASHMGGSSGGGGHAAAPPSRR